MRQNRGFWLLALSAMGLAGCGDTNAVTAGGSTDESVTDAAGQRYKTVTIGGKVWMAENLNYSKGGTVGLCYENSADSCAKYGRLYTWAEVMQGANSSGASPSGVQGICPAGWHVPSDTELTVLTSFVAGASDSGAFALKSKSGWDYGGDGKDTYGFRALPGGHGSSSGTVDAGRFGFWWSASARDADNAWSIYMFYGDSGVNRMYQPKHLAFSLRCSKDFP